MKCRKCEIEKEIIEFPIKRRVCKKCCSKQYYEWALKNKDKILKNSKRYREENRKLLRKRCLDLYHKQPWKNKEYRENNPEKQKIYRKRYREKNTVKLRRNEQNKEKKIHTTLEGKARKAVYLAIKRGEFFRHNKCQMCNLECKTEAHHKDYNYPLEVIWVCKLCHSGIHTTLRRNKINVNSFAL